ncbi:MAG: ribosome-associated translation inhibitor RaiA [Bacteroidales bacterium]|jgi:putative sigma-54 modulation protein|nr:ribosome-associated translation inhibitor RaiA [Bacteroidales bacterium]MBR6310219.1 ribosome-associated translation inhibitor RaiA [Paludibacteraceae bacterium]MDD6356753.1 ribosome-associated translation inhibitor RaiA [Bacteroidales bacterium]
MEIRIQSIGFDATEKLKAHIEKKVNKLSRVSEDIHTVDVYLKVVKPETAQNKEAEIKLQIPNAELFASKVTDTFEESVDLSVEALEKQIIKNKEKLRSR